MRLGGLIEQPNLSPEVVEKRLLFLEKTGYGSKDVLVHNPATDMVMVRNGGTFHISPVGEVEHLSGPAPDLEDEL